MADYLEIASLKPGQLVIVHQDFGRGVKPYKRAKVLKVLSDFDNMIRVAVAREGKTDILITHYRVSSLERIGEDGTIDGNLRYTADLEPPCVEGYWGDR